MPLAKKTQKSEAIFRISNKTRSATEIKLNFEKTEFRLRGASFAISDFIRLSECSFTEAGEARLNQAISRLSLSARAYHRILKLARTIADLAGKDNITSAYIGEAIQYRRLDRSASG